MSLSCSTTSRIMKYISFSFAWIIDNLLLGMSLLSLTWSINSSVKWKEEDEASIALCDDNSKEIEKREHHHFLLYYLCIYISAWQSAHVYQNDNNNAIWEHEKCGWHFCCWMWKVSIGQMNVNSGLFVHFVIKCLTKDNTIFFPSTSLNKWVNWTKIEISFFFLSSLVNICLHLVVISFS